MPKTKNKSSLKRRIKVTGTGKLLVRKMGRRHNTGKKAPKVVRQGRAPYELSPSSAKALKKVAPYIKELSK